MDFQKTENDWNSLRMELSALSVRAIFIIREMAKNSNDERKLLNRIQHKQKKNKICFEAREKKFVEQQQQKEKIVFMKHKNESQRSRSFHMYTKRERENESVYICMFIMKDTERKSSE